VHHLQAGVGHYGVFSGRRWNNEIYPLLRDFVHVKFLTLERCFGTARAFARLRPPRYEIPQNKSREDF